MQVPYLIHRLELPYDDARISHTEIDSSQMFSPNKKGEIYLSEYGLGVYKKVHRWDYMGSAEFEFGAIPENLKEFIEIREHLVTMLVKVPNGKSVYVIAHKDQIEEIPEVLKELIYSKKRVNTKERVGLLENVFERFSFASKYPGWFAYKSQIYDSKLNKTIHYHPFYFVIDHELFLNLKKIFVSNQVVLVRSF